MGKNQQNKLPLANIQAIMKISRAVNPAVLSHISTGLDYGVSPEAAQLAMESFERSRPAIAAMKSIQATARLGELNAAEQHAMGYQGQIGTAIGPFGTVVQPALGIEGIVREFDAAIGAQLPNQIVMNGFQGSWPAIEASNQQMAVFKGQGVPYAQIIENLRQSDFLQRNHDLLVSPAVQIYETCSSLPDIVSTCAQTLDVLAPIESIIASINGIRLFDQLSPLLETILSTRPTEIFWRAYQRKCLLALMDAKWSPSLLFDIPEQEMIPLNKILTKDTSHEERVEAIDRFVFRHFGRDYIAGILEDWASLPIPPHIQQLMCEAVKAYRRKEYGLVIHSLPMQWEGIIKQKTSLPERVKSDVLKDAAEELISANSYPKILSTFYREFIMYQCNSSEDYIPDIPGRNTVAHGWFPEYPSRKAALNAVLFTDFLLHLDRLEDCEAS